ncbi:Alpha-type protein kinase domain-containing protein [Mycena venus]|uniref:Alpha-type protein kinase domain-containing protein n=1 Tax=Mycena venus TaxID=2733690 RepID=A0A8H7CPQ7_9AGAR|nr:Alpha-type protein kinase domain-containing protein [Mycena venus]
MHTSERIEFYQLKQCPLYELLGSNEAQGAQFSTCDPGHASQGSILVEFSQNIGVGTFKTAHTGHLTSTHLAQSGLGMTPNELVAVKRMYRRRTAAEGSAVLRFPPADEYAKTVQEANLLYWASSLMEFTYSAIRHRVSQTGQETLPVTIPYLRFVHAGVAVSHDQVMGTNISNASSIRRTYLVEEFIEEASDGFVKFVHNGDANPLLDHDDPLYDIAEFLCFTQHLQYFKTDGSVFVSDLQDPQIMTSPKVANGKDLFGDGNVASVFEKFPEQHHCNEYCTWFGLPELT